MTLMLWRVLKRASLLNFIIHRTPDVLPHFIARFDEAISLCHHELDDADCELKLNFMSLKIHGHTETDLMSYLMKIGYDHVLKHTLFEIFFYLKWLCVRKIFLLSLMFHSIFAALFTGYVYVKYTITKIDATSFFGPC